MRILKYNGKLVEEAFSYTNEKVVGLRYIKQEDKEKCPHCDEPIDRDILIAEGCLNWKSDVSGVESL